MIKKTYIYILFISFVLGDVLTTSAGFNIGLIDKTPYVNYLYQYNIYTASILFFIIKTLLCIILYNLCIILYKINKFTGSIIYISIIIPSIYIIICNIILIYEKVYML